MKKPLSASSSFAPNTLIYLPVSLTLSMPRSPPQPHSSGSVVQQPQLTPPPPAEEVVAEPASTSAGPIINNVGEDEEELLEHPRFPVVDDQTEPAQHGTKMTTMTVVLRPTRNGARTSSTSEQGEGVLC